MAKIVVVDSDAIFAIYNPNDALNEKAILTFRRLISKSYQLIYPISVIFEVISLFQRVLPITSVTTRLLEMIKNDEVFIYTVDIEILKQSVELFDPSGSKKKHPY